MPLMKSTTTKMFKPTELLYLRHKACIIETTVYKSKKTWPAQCSVPLLVEINVFVSCNCVIIFLNGIKSIRIKCFQFRKKFVAVCCLDIFKTLNKL